MPCKACIDRGKTWQGSDPKCAFEDSAFSPENWNCATMSLLRKLATVEDSSQINHYWANNENYATISLIDVKNTDSALTLWISWYKKRGRTQAMWLLFDDEPPRLPTYEECLVILEHYKNYIN
jgi:hypothetical protein